MPSKGCLLEAGVEVEEPVSFGLLAEAEPLSLLRLLSLLASDCHDDQPSSACCCRLTVDTASRVSSSRLPRCCSSHCSEPYLVSCCVNRAFWICKLSGKF